MRTEIQTHAALLLNTIIQNTGGLIQ